MQSLCISTIVGGGLGMVGKYTTINTREREKGGSLGSTTTRMLIYRLILVSVLCESLQKMRRERPDEGYYLMKQTKCQGREKDRIDRPMIKTKPCYIGHYVGRDDYWIGRPHLVLLASSYVFII